MIEQLARCAYCCSTLEDVTENWCATCLAEGREVEFWEWVRANEQRDEHEEFLGACV